ncbi:MAG: helix-turn-helix transcriptional regulator [Caldilineaceae bacterium]
MHDYNKAAGTMLRSLRRQRGLTQIEAARLLNTSSPVLSRKERGQEQIERLDIQLAIVGYQLNYEESQALWSAAGYLPEPTLRHEQQNNLCDRARSLLAELPFPAFIVDASGQVQAWNQSLAALWPASDAPVDQCPVNQPAFCQWLRQRTAKYEEELVAKGQDAQQNSQVQAERWTEELRNALVQYASPFGPIAYLVLQTTFSFPHAYELIVYVPFGLEDQRRYEQFKAQMEINQLFLGKQAFAQYRAEAPT